ncbi:hypothetical protein [Vibrio sp. J502]|uniref:hypothetical protein n=1 Tax=Vibrio sp. J502 TaxID=2978741 RepID=UPI0021C18EBD|nr:hypothetical protein [Vibrio sp. J502]UXH28407.1 hypothetical protein N5E84_00420 [Vibrio sp. J502]
MIANLKADSAVEGRLSAQSLFKKHASKWRSQGQTLALEASGSLGDLTLNAKLAGLRTQT